MTGRENLMRLLLLFGLLLTVVTGKKDAVFVYSRLRGDALLPCINPVSQDCSLITWTFYKGGRVRYTEEVIRGQPGGTLTLNCILFTYYDVGSCKSYSSMFNLSWAAEDGSMLPKDTRYAHIAHTRCNTTLVTKLQGEDNNRKWRCQVNAADNSRATFLDFTSTFLFQPPSTAQTLIPSETIDCPVQLPISRIVLCAALPVMVLIVGFFTWKGDRKRAKLAAAGIELQEIN
ncbi:uncharacterized protein LOC126404499 isoform X2 [Epinephelus moara]|uniref:uncharacterized protein LOC126404499 isoform X2 n=1 Tax=Epinephelus moara TaxID=300413 RepID=UPI00214EF668|nr:uncharacterized protein LOC126404499 isoform X2 [Epinephelus moara]